MESQNKTPILIIGTQAEARVALDIANAMDVLVYGFITLNEKERLQEVNDILIVAELESQDAKTLLEDKQVKLVLAERDIDMRSELADLLPTSEPEVISLIHPAATISPYAKVARGCLVYAGVVIQANAMIGSFCQIESNVSIDADAFVGDFCTLQSGVVVGRESVVETEAFVGMGAVIYPGVTVGKGAQVTAGSVVMQDVPDGKQVFGNPAKVV